MIDFRHVYKTFRTPDRKEVKALVDFSTAINRGEVMVIPHQHARTNWGLHDPELERVVEIYSHWGCGLSPESEPPMIPGTTDRV